MYNLIKIFSKEENVTHLKDIGKVLGVNGGTIGITQSELIQLAGVLEAYGTVILIGLSIWYTIVKIRRMKSAKIEPAVKEIKDE